MRDLESLKATMRALESLMVAFRGGYGVIS
jgi:hypothetical protein